MGRGRLGARGKESEIRRRDWEGVRFGGGETGMESEIRMRDWEGE